ncbi:MAG: response regulator, partial [Deltaproteobacteria bacterium]|nr:response regulator [Deltaproteobacteria bacterium]
ISPIRDPEGKITNFVSINRDVTMQARLENQLRQAQKMEAIGTLAGGVAHDFNNILGSIFGYTQLALDDAKSGIVNVEFLEEIFKAAKRAKNLVQQILVLSRQTKYEKKPIELAPIIYESMKLMRASLPANIEINQEILAEKTTILGDSTQIHQVLMNLCTNAAHAMQENGGTLNIRLADVYLDARDAVKYIGMSPGPHLRLTVSDTGHGMDRRTRDRIFDPFFTTKEMGKGTGMGLAIVHGIIKNHGGAITVYSEPGQGTTFNILLPRMNSQSELTIDQSETIPTGSETVLLVDDELGLLEAGKMMLTRLGYNVTAKTSSLTALETFAAHPEDFDLLITDMTMPGMTGDKLAREILGIRPDLPIILCTGFSEAISEEKAEQTGIKGFIMKPIDLNSLARLIRKVLGE